MKIAYVPYYEQLLCNEAFNLNNPMNVNGGLERWVALRERMHGQGMRLDTYDNYSKTSEIDVWLMGDVSPALFRLLMSKLINPRKVLWMLTEPPVVLPCNWKYLHLYKWFHRAILTWNTDLCKRDTKFMHWHFPVNLDMSKYCKYASRQKQNLCLMMHSNKSSKIDGELYSMRREIIGYFSNRKDTLLDLYGRGWNTNCANTGHASYFTRLYRGFAEDKMDTFSKYNFVFCIDNSIEPGYITYDPLLAMATGTVPVYMPMPDSEQYIPREAWIDFCQYKSLDDLVEYMLQIEGTDRFEEYRRNGRDFLNSEKFVNFTLGRFCEDVIAAVNTVTSGRKNNEVRPVHLQKKYSALFNQ